MDSGFFNQPTNANLTSDPLQDPDVCSKVSHVGDLHPLPLPGGRLLHQHLGHRLHLGLLEDLGGFLQERGLVMGLLSLPPILVALIEDPLDWPAEDPRLDLGGLLRLLEGAEVHLDVWDRPSVAPLGLASALRGLLLLPHSILGMVEGVLQSECSAY